MRSDLHCSSSIIEIDLTSKNLSSCLVKTTSDEVNKRLLTENFETNTSLLSTFGILTDVQFAEHETHISFENKHRFYKNSLNLVKEAVCCWKDYGKVDFVLQLGDIIDGKCKVSNESLSSLNLVLDELKKSQEEAKILHVWGNHEFYNFKRSELIHSELNSAWNLKQNIDKPCNYYFYDVTNNLRMICLDFYEFSVLGYEETDNEYLEASKYIESLGKSENYTYPKINGAIKGEQLKWLEEQLNLCKNENKKAIVCGHNPLSKEASKEKFVSLNAAQILELLWSYDHVIIAYVSGHFHQGGYFRDKCDIHHITLPGIIEKHPGSNSFMTVKVFEEKICFYLNNSESHI